MIAVCRTTAFAFNRKSLVVFKVIHVLFHVLLLLGYLLCKYSMINITSNAKTKITDLLMEENNPKLALRTFVQGGGCSGFSYGFTFDEEFNEDDFEFPIGEFKVIVDAMSMQYLQGAEIDYKEDLQGSSFSIKNPNAQSTCGCGSSFAV
jgi:iron-sulfur cluster insertion protein